MNYYVITLPNTPAFCCYASSLSNAIKQAQINALINFQYSAFAQEASPISFDTYELN